MITASIVSYHSPTDELSNLLDCIIQSSIDILYLVDNSTNDSLRELSGKSSKIAYIHSDNLGFGHGHNIAISKALERGARYHVVINPDIYWKGKVIEDNYLKNTTDPNDKTFADLLKIKNIDLNRIQKLDNSTATNRWLKFITAQNNEERY